MFETFLHFIGFCPDHFSHLNILDVPWQDLINFFNSFKSFLKK